MKFFLFLLPLLSGALYAVNNEDSWSSEPLIHAALRADAAGVRQLLEQGENPNVRSERGYTVLMAAAHAGDVETVRMLLAAGADVHAVTVRQSTVLHSLARADLPYCTGCRGMSQSDVVLELYRLENQLLEVLDMLLAAGAKVDAPDARGKTPLFLAMHRHERLAGRLLAAGANPNARTADGTTMLMAAAFLRKPDVVRALLKRGAEVNAVRSRDGYTALFCAVESERDFADPEGKARLEVVRLLLDAGANQYLKDRRGREAKDAGGAELRDMLQRGVLPEKKN